ncbi:DnaD domain-containing protein [Psychrobacillus vulpis]|uniref:DnaD domain protein n=1 Tax=Psychrobacillus vulpis TaxID=2325572 RepID=A0A544TWL6_9BACI|nr:DnaD domain protein [Psychrobacillus vulpis]TQR21821.1 DnaD domain protein [Psychrobacillus vulpis]
MAGWISLHRKIMDNPIYSNAFMLKLWIHCLMKASHKEHEQLVGNQMVKLEPGQFVTGRNALAEEFNKGAKKDEVISAITLWRWLKNFEEWQMLNIKTTTKYSVVTVINWSEHQQHEQQVNNKRTADEQQVNTNNNVNNVNKKEIININSPELAKIIQFYQSNIGPLIPNIGEAIVKDVDTFGEELVLEALTRATLANKRNYGYVNGILRKWRDTNIKSVDDVKAADTEFQRNRTPKLQIVPPPEKKKEKPEYNYGF